MDYLMCGGTHRKKSMLILPSMLDKEANLLSNQDKKGLQEKGTWTAPGQKLWKYWDRDKPIRGNPVRIWNPLRSSGTGLVWLPPWSFSWRRRQGRQRRLFLQHADDNFRWHLQDLLKIQSSHGILWFPVRILRRSPWNFFATGLGREDGMSMGKLRVYWLSKFWISAWRLRWNCAPILHHVELFLYKEVICMERHLSFVRGPWSPCS